MTWHPASNWVNPIADFAIIIFKQITKFFNNMLRLSNCHSVPWND